MLAVKAPVDVQIEMAGALALDVVCHGGGPYFSD
jgi:hypothetical protein